MRIVRLLNRITDAAAFIGILVILPLVAAMVYEVFSRYALNAPTRWSFEVSYMMMAAIFVLGIGYALKERQHVNVDFIYGSLSPRARAVVNLTGYVLFLPAICWITYALFNYALSAYRSGEVSGVSAWNPVVWPMRAILTLGFAVLVLQIVAHIIECIRALVTNEGRNL